MQSPFAWPEISPSSGARAGVDFTLVGSTVWEAEGLDVTFKVSHVGGQRLVVESLQLSGEQVTVTLLGKFPVAELLTLVRAWILDGKPNGAIEKAASERGIDLRDFRGYREWTANHERFTSLIAGTEDGAKRGRKVQRDDAYLRDLTTKYLRIAAKNRTNPRAELVAGEADKKGEAGILSDLMLARRTGWLAGTSNRGARREQEPGPRLLAEWDQHGYPRWYKGPKKNSPGGSS